MKMRTANASRPRLSVAMIVRNEQDLLADTVASVQSIADEVVVLDTGSTDQTVAVARRLGAVVERAAWTDDFSAARNRCLQMVSGQWVLWLDAGERLHPVSATALRAFIDRQADPKKAYTLLVQVPPPDTIASGEQAARVRLMPNQPGLRFEGRVRETLLPSLRAWGLEIATGPGQILRHGRQHDPALKTLKATRVLNLATLEIAETGRTPLRLLLAMGEAYGDLGLYDPARTTFQKAIEAAAPGSSEMLEAYYGLLTSLDADPFFCDLQLNACLEALDVFPLDAQLLLSLGSFMQKRQHLELATRAFAVAVKHGQIDASIGHLIELHEVAAICLNLTLQMRDLDDEARGVLEEALERHPRSSRIVRHLIDLHVKHAQCQKATGLIDRLPLPPEGRKWLATAIQGACQAVQRDWKTALSCLDSAYRAGCRDPLLLRWLSITYLSTGELEAARPILAEWQQQEPHHGELQGYLAVLREYGETGSAAEERTASDLGDRTFRVDRGTAVPQAAPPQLPIVSPISSADVPIF